MNYSIDRVVLGYDEVELVGILCVAVQNGDPDVSLNCWRNGDGHPEAKPNGCGWCGSPRSTGARPKSSSSSRS